jgi:hypothetical protein
MFPAEITMCFYGESTLLYIWILREIEFKQMKKAKLINFF